MSSEETPKRKSSLGWILCAAAMVVVFLLGMLAASINERKAEVASIYNNKKIELTQTNAKNGDWGLNYPREYETWKMTEKGDFKSKYNGNDEHDVLADRPNMVMVNFHSKCKILGGVAEFFSEAFLCRFPPEDFPRPVVYPVHSLPV